MLIVILACLICGFISLVGLMAINCGGWNCHQSLNQNITADGAVQECLKRKVIDSLPRQVFKCSSLKEAAECVICLAEFEEGEEVREFPSCCHVFHVECIDTWLIGSQSSSCPSCRQKLVVADQCQTCRNCVPVVSQQLEPEFLP